MLVLFIGFFACCVASMWQVKKIQNALIDRHPDKYLEIERSSVFPMQGLWRFAQGKQHEQLGDAELSLEVKRLKSVYIVAFLFWLGYAIAIFSSFD